MTSIEFERLLSAYGSEDSPCIRDLIFDYYCRRFPNDPARPTEFMKKYTDALYERLVGRSRQSLPQENGHEK
jgi:hypothetical protein